MRIPLLRFLAVLILLAGVVGCSGSSTDSGTSSSAGTLTLAFDTDNDGIPDVFDDFPDDPANHVFAICDENKYPTSHQSMETAIGKNSPFTAPTTFKGTIDAANGTDYFAVNINGGTPYSLVFYDPQKMDGRAVTFVPDVNVYAGPGARLPLELSVVGEARAIILSFTPGETGTHYISIRNAETNTQAVSYRYRFDLIEDSARKGMGILFKAADGGGYTYSYADILLLRNTLKPYVEEWTADGVPRTFRDGARSAFQSTINYLAGVHADPQCTDTTPLDPYVAEIPWNSEYRFGYGISATTGLPARQLQAVASFSLPAPPGAPTQTETDLLLIQTDDEYAKEVQGSVTTHFSAFGTSVSASASYTDNIKYSEKETTLLLKYYMEERDYRLLETQAYALIPDAKTYVNDQPADFRNKYGDYFIAGAKYGAQYIATLHITAQSAEEIRTVTEQIELANKTFKADATETYKAKFSEATKNCKVEVRRVTTGGDATVLSIGTTPDQMFDDLIKFMISVNSSNMAPLKAYMLRFNQIPDATKLPDRINVNVCALSEALDLSRNYLALSTRAKIIAGLDAATFQPGVQDNYAKEFNDLTYDLHYNRDNIFNDKAQVDNYGIQVKAMLDKFSNLIERQSFFVKLVQVRRAWPISTDRDQYDWVPRESGFASYLPSFTVNNDIGSVPAYGEDHAEPYVYSSEWYPSWDPGVNSVVCYVKIAVTFDWTRRTYTNDLNYPSMGRRPLQLWIHAWDAGFWRLDAKGVYLGEGGKSPTGNYPFNWALMD